MVDIRQSPSSDSKVTFDAISVAGDLWMRQNYHGIHIELSAQEAKDFAKTAEGAGLIVEKSQAVGSPSDTDLAH